jgi:hypothetical protein
MRIGLALLVWGTRPVVRTAPDVSGFGARQPMSARRDTDRALAAHQHPFPPLAR